MMAPVKLCSSADRGGSVSAPSVCESPAGRTTLLTWERSRFGIRKLANGGVMIAKLAQAMFWV